MGQVGASGTTPPVHLSSFELGARVLPREKCTVYFVLPPVIQEVHKEGEIRMLTLAIKTHHKPLMPPLLRIRLLIMLGKQGHDWPAHQISSNRRERPLSL